MNYVLALLGALALIAYLHYVIRFFSEEFARDLEFVRDFSEFETEGGFGDIDSASSNQCAEGANTISSERPS